MTKRVMGSTSYDLDPKVKVKDQIMYFLVDASPHKLLDVSTLNFVDACISHMR